MNTTILKTIAIALISLTANAEISKTITSKNIRGMGGDAKLTQTVNLETNDNISEFISQLEEVQSYAKEDVNYSKDYDLYTLSTTDESKYVWLVSGFDTGFLAKGQVKKLIKILNKIK